MLKYAACVARRLRLYAMSVRCHAVLVYIHIWLLGVDGLIVQVR